MDQTDSVDAAVPAIGRVRPSSLSSCEARARPPAARASAAPSSWELLFAGGSESARRDGSATAAVEVAVHDERTRAVLLVTREIMVTVHHTAAEATAQAAGSVPAPTLTTISAHDVQTQIAVAAPVAPTPEASADRIVEFAAGLFPSYAQRQPTQELGAAAAAFARLAQQAVATGAAKAVESLGTVPARASADIGRTVQLAQQGLAQWAAQVSEAAPRASAA